MDSLSKDISSGLLEKADPPCISLYQPTHRHYPDNQQDPIRFRNLVREVEESLLKKYPQAETDALLQPFAGLAEDRDFWHHAQDGLAVLAANDLFRVYRIQRTVPEFAVVADTFHRKPLFRILQSADRYHVLALTRNEAKLFEGNRDALDEVDLPESFPRTLTQALGSELTDPHHTVASYAGAGRTYNAMHHGHGGKESEVEIDTERFFRAVDRAVTEEYSKPTKLPLILATLPEHRGEFEKVTHNTFLMKAGPDVHPDALTTDELRQEAWKIVEVKYLERLRALVEDYGTARANALGDDDPKEIAKALAAGRVRMLIVDADRRSPGRVDLEIGGIESESIDDPGVDDLFDDLAEITLAKGGEVVVVPAERMPTDTGAAAIYRY
jgi:hypothetical protein